MESADKRLSRRSEPPSVETAVQAITKLQNEGKLTMEVALKGRQLSTYKREAGEEVVGAVLTMLILSISEAYNIKKEHKIGAIQATEIAKAILKEFWYLKLAELYLFAEKAKNGEFGKVYDRLDRAVIFEWVRAYDTQREDHLFAEMQGRNETDDAPEIDEETKRLNQEKADKALSELAQKLKSQAPTGSTIQDKLTDPKFRKAAFDYDHTSPEQIAIREHNRNIGKQAQKISSPE